jgi:hypothetical protein
VQKVFFDLEQTPELSLDLDDNQMLGRGATLGLILPS